MQISTPATAEMSDADFDFLLGLAEEIDKDGVAYPAQQITNKGPPPQEAQQSMPQLTSAGSHLCGIPLASLKAWTWNPCSCQLQAITLDAPADRSENGDDDLKLLLELAAEVEGGGDCSGSPKKHLQQQSARLDEAGREFPTPGARKRSPGQAEEAELIPDHPNKRHRLGTPVGMQNKATTSAPRCSKPAAAAFQSATGPQKGGFAQGPGPDRQAKGAASSSAPAHEKHSGLRVRPDVHRHMPFVNEASMYQHDGVGTAPAAHACSAVADEEPRLPQRAVQ